MFICTSYNIPLPKSRFNAVCKGSSSFTVTKRLSFLRGFDDTNHSKKGFVGTLQENTVISRKAVGINVHSTLPKGNMGYDQYTVPDTAAVEPTFVAPKHTSMASRAILANFFEELSTENHPQYLSGLLRAFFPTTFLEIAVYL